MKNSSKKISAIWLLFSLFLGVISFLLPMSYTLAQDEEINNCMDTPKIIQSTQISKTQIQDMGVFFGINDPLATVEKKKNACEEYLKTLPKDESSKKNTYGYYFMQGVDMATDSEITQTLARNTNFIAPENKNIKKIKMAFDLPNDLMYLEAEEFSGEKINITAQFIKITNGLPNILKSQELSFISLSEDEIKKHEKEKYSIFTGTESIAINETNGKYFLKLKKAPEDLNTKNLHPLLLLKGSVTIDGILVNKDSVGDIEEKATILISDEKEGQTSIEIEDLTHGEAVSYDGKGAGVSTIEEGQIKGVVEADSSDELFGSIINFVLSFVGVIAVLIMIYAGVRLLVAGGDDNEHSSALNMLKYSAIGIIVIISAYTITNTLLNLGGDVQQTITVAIKEDLSGQNKTLLGIDLSRSDCVYFGHEVGTLRLCNQDDMLIFKILTENRQLNFFWELDEIVGTCKDASIISLCVDPKFL